MWIPGHVPKWTGICTIAAAGKGMLGCRSMNYTSSRMLGLNRTSTHETRLRALVVSAGVSALVALPVSRAVGQETAPPPAPAPVTTPAHVVTGVVIKYVRENPDHPPADSLLSAVVDAAPTQDGWAAPRPREATQRFRLADISRLQQQRFTDTGLTLLAPAVVQHLKDLGLVGVYVTPDPAQFRVEDGRVVDLRPQGVTTVTLQVTTGTVTDVRTVGIGERLPPDATVNNPVHQRIRDNSPVAPRKEGVTGTTNLMRGDIVDDYLFRLSRYPGRRADAALSASGEEPGAVTLDYVITENRPWLLFAQLSNTGTDASGRLREHFGFIHNQLTNDDDTLTLGYETSNFSDMHTAYGSYERPFPGTDVVRWQVNGSWYKYTAADVGLPGSNFKGEGWNAGGQVAWNFYQRRELFLDLVGGFQYKHISVDNQVSLVHGSDDFFVPSVGVRLERNLESMRTNASLGFEFNVPGIAGTSDNLDALGRTGADSSYSIIKGEGVHSFYLEPLFDPDATNTGGLANEVLLVARAQIAAWNRLIPNEQQVAGGLYTVRGYPESITAGDSAIIGTVEYRYHLPKGLAANPTPGTLFGKEFRYRPQYQYGPTDWDLILKAFVDAGRVWNTDRMSFEKDQTLVGVGIGAELAVTRHFNVRVDWGFALKGLTDSTGASIVDDGHNELEFVATLVY
jgi:hemolysin activation/secretion protein